MPIKLNIITAFDDRELKRAQRQISQVGRSISRGLDIAVLGGLSALGAGLAASVKSLARIETINAQTETVIKSMGNAAGVSASQIEEMTGKLEALTATEAETIQQGANLLLTFGNIKDAAGAGNDIFTQTVTAMVDMGRAMGTDASSSAIQLGKALNDPTKGITALTRVGVSFTQQQKDQIKALQASGDIMGAQKIILGELQNQFGGSGAAYAKTFTGQLALMRHELGTMGEEMAMAVMPAMQDLVAALREMIPEIGPKLKAAVESVDWKALANALLFIVKHLQEIATTVTVLWAMSAAFRAIAAAIQIATAAQVLFATASAVIKAVTTAIQGATAAQLLFNIAQAATPWGLIALGISGIAAAWILSADAANAYRDASADATDTGPSGGAPITPKGKNGKPLTLTEYNKEQAKKNKPADPLADLKSQLDGLKTTTDTVKKADTSAADAAKKASEARAKALADARQLADDAKKAFEDLKTSINNFNTSFATTAEGFRQVFRFTKPLGEFESQAVDAFESMKNAAQEAFDNGLIEKTALASLRSYADKESALLVGIAKDRDKLAKKISIAQSVTAGVMGSLDINAMLQTKTVTKSVTSIVNGIALTTTQSFDEVVTGGLANSFKKLVAKTKTFAGNLVKLKQLGLNGNLFKQIVEGGADAGGATAEAIIAGGADAVKELNGLFTELTDAGADIAKTSTPVLYDLGENMTNSFIDGLRSQDQQLIDSANSMAALFTEQFKSELNLAIAPTVAATQNAAMSAQMSVDLSSRPDPKRSPQSYANWLSSIGGIDPVRSPEAYARSQANTYNVTINAGAITDQASLPTIVTNALVTATKQGLTGGLSRLLAV